MLYKKKNRKGGEEREGERRGVNIEFTSFNLKDKEDNFFHSLLYIKFYESSNKLNFPSPSIPSLPLPTLWSTTLAVKLKQK
jgi:hypothetical protein